MEKENVQFRKNFIWNIIGTGFSAFNSLFFMIVVTRINGVNEAGIFTLAFSTACILYMIGIYAGRVYQVTENDSEISHKDYIINRFITCGLTLILVITFTLIRQYDIYKSSIFIILAIYKSLEAFSEVLYGILQKNNMLEKVGKSAFFKAIIGIIIFVVIDIITKKMLISCISLVVVNLIIILFYDTFNIKQFISKDETINKKSILRIFRNGFFTFAIAFLGVYLTNAQKYAIDNFLTENIQAIFGIIIMPATVMGLLAQFIIHPFLNQLFNNYNNKEYEEIKKMIFKIMIFVIGVGGICCILGYLLGTPVLGLLYNIDLHEYKLALLIILMGATLYTIANIISSILVTMRYTFIQFILSLIVVLIEYIISSLLVQKFEIMGATYAYLITMIVYCITYVIMVFLLINKKIKEGENKNEHIVHSK